MEILKFGASARAIRFHIDFRSCSIGILSLFPFCDLFLCSMILLCSFVIFLDLKNMFVFLCNTLLLAFWKRKREFLLLGLRKEEECFGHSWRTTQNHNNSSHQGNKHVAVKEKETKERKSDLKKFEVENK